ncbi:lipase secretion chaperone [Stigmatella sp. ncwal1]|uniref:Lipase helper protein n=1 Tax=Stigmatella ashevillensis TaxID=2995309 RepID=A0ABT5DQI8_9BACT|nr:lipase secretion chaperone [Stigmatella ashevillena]MDC0714647.1 lipase secretion chaperone [Stigmatella ashevillena]
MKRFSFLAALGLLVCVALWGGMAGSFRPSSPSETPLPSPRPSPPFPALRPGRSASPSTPLPSAEHIQAQLLVAQARQSLAQISRRATSQSDFSLAPNRVLRSLLARRCGLVARHAEALLAQRDALGLEGEDGAGLCSALLFRSLQQRLSLPENLTEAAFWKSLEQVDATYARLVVDEPSSAQDKGYFSAVERFREERRRLLGPELDARLFGLSDEMLRLPAEVSALLGAPGTSGDDKVAAWQGVLQRIEHTHGVRLADVMEPVELARQELRLRESAGPLDEASRHAVLERYAGSEVAQRDQEHRHEQEERGERLRAFNTERERILAELTRAGMTPEQLRQRMPEIDQRLIEQYQLR